LYSSIAWLWRRDCADEDDGSNGCRLGDVLPPPDVGLIGPGHLLLPGSCLLWYNCVESIMASALALLPFCREWKPHCFCHMQYKVSVARSYSCLLPACSHACRLPPYKILLQNDFQELLPNTPTASCRWHQLPSQLHRLLLGFDDCLPPQDAAAARPMPLDRKELVLINRAFEFCDNYGSLHHVNPIFGKQPLPPHSLAWLRYLDAGAFFRIIFILRQMQLRWVWCYVS
jgi:hypothetical protein